MTRLLQGMTRLLQERTEASALLMLVIMLVAFSFMSPAFLTYNNFQIVLQPIPEIALIVIGVTILMISGEFDLSVGSVFVLAPMIMVICMDAGIPLPVAMLIGLIGAAMAGSVNASRCASGCRRSLRRWECSSWREAWRSSYREGFRRHFPAIWISGGLSGRSTC